MRGNKMILNMIFSYIDILIVDYLFYKVGSIQITKRVHRILLCIVPMMIVLCYHFGLIFRLWLSSLLFSILYLLYAYGFEKIWKYYIPFVCISIISNVFSVSIIRLSLGVDIAVIYQTHYFFVKVLCSRIIKFSFLPIVISFFSVPKKNKKEFIISLLILPVSTVFILYEAIHCLDQFHVFSSIFILGIFGLLLSNFLFINYFEKTLWLERVEKENELLLLKQEYQSTYMNLMDQKEKDTRVLVHDFNRHIMFLNTLLNEEAYSDAQYYVKELYHQNEQKFKKIRTGFPVLDVIFSNFQPKFLDNDIQFYSHIEVKGFDGIHIIDLNILLSNMLDNAFESCMRSSGNFISMRISEEDEAVIKIMLKNSCDEAICKDTNFETLKENKDHHGIGLVSMQEIVMKYKGKHYFTFHDDKKIFITMIELNRLVENG